MPVTTRLLPNQNQTEWANWMYWEDTPLHLLYHGHACNKHFGIFCLGLSALHIYELACRLQSQMTCRPWYAAAVKQLLCLSVAIIMKEYERSCTCSVEHGGHKWRQMMETRLHSLVIPENPFFGKLLTNITLSISICQYSTLMFSYLLIWNFFGSTPWTRW